MNAQDEMTRMLKKLEQRKLYVSNLYMRADGMWQCYLRKGQDTKYAAVGTGAFPWSAMQFAYKNFNSTDDGI